MFAKPLLTLLLSAFVVAYAFAQKDFAANVNPFVGTNGTGHTFPGACAPFGMAQPSPDTKHWGWGYTSGYQYADTTIMGFSQTHLSGTGMGDLGDVLLMPFTGSMSRIGFGGFAFSSRYDKKTEQATPAYYAVRLTDNHVKAEMTATARVAFHRYTFDTNNSGVSANGEKHIYLDLQHGITWDSVNKRVLASSVKIADDHRSISGFLETENWVRRKLFFVVVFDTPYKTLHELPKLPTDKAAKYVLDFEGSPVVQVKVGISTVSEDGAAANITAEVPSWNFEKTRKQTRAEWNKYLTRIDIDAPPAQKAVFYTALYHAFIQPSNIADVDGKYRASDDVVRTAPNAEYYSTFSIWDTYRAAHPLYTLLVPERVGAMVNSMLAMHETQGFLPIWALADKDNYCMIGNHATTIVADAYLKGIAGIDAERAYRAVRGTLTKNHKNSDWTTYNEYGYYPFDKVDGEAVSRSLESAVDFAAAADMAKAMGKKDDATMFSKAATNYRNLFDPASGLMRGKDSKGNWRTPFLPLRPTSPLNNPGDYTEANAWQYTFAIQHDVDGMAKLFGSRKAMLQQLDVFFSTVTDANDKYLGQEAMIGQYSHGNEPSHHIAYLYALLGEREKTNNLVRTIANRFYQNTPNGLQGNEDCGQMSAWYVFATLGFYPVYPVGGEYVLSEALVKKATIHLANGKNFVIENAEANDDPKTKFLKLTKLNATLLDQAFITHRDILRGGKLRFQVVK